jgi:hypothetical protein
MESKVRGVFGVVSEDPESREGGTSEIALVPSTYALCAVLKALGFSIVTKIPYPVRISEQFYRDRRAILLCIK